MCKVQMCHCAVKFKVFVFFPFFVLDLLNKMNLLNSTKAIQAWLKATECFSVSLTHDWFFDVMVKKPECWSVDWVFKAHKGIFHFK